MPALNVHVLSWLFASTTNKQMQDDRRPRYVDDRVITILPTKHEWRRAQKAHESLHFLNFFLGGGQIQETRNLLKISQSFDF